MSKVIGEMGYGKDSNSKREEAARREEALRRRRSELRSQINQLKAEKATYDALKDRLMALEKALRSVSDGANKSFGYISEGLVIESEPIGGSNLQEICTLSRNYANKVTENYRIIDMKISYFVTQIIIKNNELARIS